MNNTRGREQQPNANEQYKRKRQLNANENYKRERATTKRQWTIQDKASNN